MGKILLCGNGMNIKFEDKFRMEEFIELLLNEKKLRIFFADNQNFLAPKVEAFNTFTEFNISSYYKKIDNFCWIIKKCQEEVGQIVKASTKNGVETVFKELFEKVDEYLAFEENDDLSYDKFESTFKELFFTYIWKLQNQSLVAFNSEISSQYPNFKVKLDGYKKIITLNYDTILETLIPTSSRDIIHWHGVLKIKQDGNLDYSKCLLETIRNPKSSQSFKQIALFKKYEKFKNKYELDIFGLNPMNDENVFALFINSQICNKINFYYHSDNDIANLDEVLKKIQYTWLELNKNNTKVSLSKKQSKRFVFFKEEKQKYFIKFYQEQGSKVSAKEDGSLEINLISSDVFWRNCQRTVSDSIGLDQEIINTF